MMSQVNITIDNKIRIGGYLPHDLMTKIEDRFTIENPEFLNAERLGFSTVNKPRYISAYEWGGNTMILPRGAIRPVLSLLRSERAPYHITDNRRACPLVELAFQGQLRDYQQAAVDAMIGRQFGTLSAPTGSGKTVMALYIIAARKQPALVIVHTRELLHQWVARIESFLGIPRQEIGIIGGGKKRLGRELTVAIVNSLYPIANQVREHVGHLIVDECHRCPSRTFSEAVSAFDCKYMLGLSATPFRRDGLTELIYWHLGDKVHEISQDSLQESGDVLRADVIFRGTRLTTTCNPSSEYQRMISELIRDYERNDLIIADVVKEVQSGNGICLVLSDRKDHCMELTKMLAEHEISTEVLIGGFGMRKRQDIIKRVNAGKVQVLVATGQLIGEGFDCRELSTLFLATPIKFSGRLIQYLGRVLRPAPGKDKAQIYDYVDVQVGVLANAARARQRVYGR